MKDLDGIDATMVLLGTFTGTKDTLLKVLHLAANGTLFDGRRYLVEVGQNEMSFALWLHDPLGENDYSHFFQGWWPMEIICGIFLEAARDGIKVSCSTNVAITRFDKMGQKFASAVKMTEHTRDLDSKQETFLSAFIENAQALHCWAP